MRVLRLLSRLQSSWKLCGFSGSWFEFRVGRSHAAQQSQGHELRNHREVK